MFDRKRRVSSTNFNEALTHPPRGGCDVSRSVKLFPAQGDLTTPRKTAGSVCDSRHAFQIPPTVLNDPFYARVVGQTRRAFDVANVANINPFATTTDYSRSA